MEVHGEAQIHLQPTEDASVLLKEGIDGWESHIEADILVGLVTHGVTHWSSLFLKNCTHKKGPTVKKFMKNCNKRGGLTLGSSWKTVENKLTLEEGKESSP